MESLTTLHHVAMSVRDIEESIKWYDEFFGLKLLSRMTLPHNGTLVAFIGNSDFIIELFERPGANPLPPDRSHPDTDNMTHGCKHFCVCVENNVEFVKDLKARGVQIAFEPKGVPNYCAFVLDPTGNIVEIFDKTNDVSAM
jgi:methylmalonyl-CoA/ethylmalonyl-CoA epimerase